VVLKQTRNTFKNVCFLLLTAVRKIETGIKMFIIYLFLIFISGMPCNIIQKKIKQADTLNSSHENLSKVNAALQTRCKQYFSVKL